MKVFHMIGILCLFCTHVWAVDTSCTQPTELNCDYYNNCVESSLPCGSDGYAIGYGQLYCQRFLDTKYSTHFGDMWRDATLLCLQRELSLFMFFWPAQPKTCSNIKNYAYKSHADCYVRPNPSAPVISICYLSPADVALTTKNIKTVDMLRWNGLKQMAQVAKLCLSMLGDNKSLGYSNISLEKQRAFWRKMLKSQRD